MVEALVLKLLMEVAQTSVKNGALSRSAPTVTEISASASFADLSQSILKCYHRTARYQSADIVEAPWSREAQYGAEKSALIRITYYGMTGKSYEMLVGVAGRENQIRADLQLDTATVPANNRCALQQWITVS